jgi:nicotinamidase-related amidase
MKKILVVIDMQNDFIDGALGTPEAAAIVENVKAKILSYPKENVFATRDTHHQYYMDTQEGRNLPVPHCIRGTDGWQIRPEIAELIFPDHVVDKPTFGSTQLAKLMEILERREEDGIEIELVGLCTDICVVSNALLLKASMPETPISCDASCCAGVTPAKHEAALETMRSCQIRIIND